MKDEVSNAESVEDAGRGSFGAQLSLTAEIDAPILVCREGVAYRSFAANSMPEKSR